MDFYRRQLSVRKKPLESTERAVPIPRLMVIENENTCLREHELTRRSDAPAYQCSSHENIISP